MQTHVSLTTIAITNVTSVSTITTIAAISPKAAIADITTSETTKTTSEATTAARPSKARLRLWFRPRVRGRHGCSQQHQHRQHEEHLQHKWQLYSTVRNMYGHKDEQISGMGVEKLKFSLIGKLLW